MSSPFEEIDAAGQAALADFLGEDVELIGMRSGQYSTARDPDRLPQTVVGVPSIVTKAFDIRGSVTGSEFSGTTQMAGALSELWLPKSTVDAMDWHPVKNDVVVLPERNGSPRFQISAVYPGDFGDIQVLMTRAHNDLGAAT